MASGYLLNTRESKEPPIYVESMQITQTMLSLKASLGLRSRTSYQPRGYLYFQGSITLDICPAPSSWYRKPVNKVRLYLTHPH